MQNNSVEPTIETKQTTYYAVVRVSDGVNVYRGDSESNAAQALIPGTVYGKGKNQSVASYAACEQMKMARKGHK